MEALEQYLHFDTGFCLISVSVCEFDMQDELWHKVEDALTKFNLIYLWILEINFETCFKSSVISKFISLTQCFKMGWSTDWLVTFIFHHG